MLEIKGPPTEAVMPEHPPLQPASEKRYVAEMGRQVAVVLYVLAMVAIIVSVDFVFFRNRFWERLIVNIGIVLVFAAFYLRFLRRL
jgi:lipopolysaccharide export LptBFGC system permease protein LptF